MPLFRYFRDYSMIIEFRVQHTIRYMWADAFRERHLVCNHDSVIECSSDRRIVLRQDLARLGLYSEKDPAHLPLFRGLEHLGLHEINRPYRSQLTALALIATIPHRDSTSVPVLPPACRFPVSLAHKRAISLLLRVFNLPRVALRELKWQVYRAYKSKKENAGIKFKFFTFQDEFVFE